MARSRMYAMCCGLYKQARARELLSWVQSTTRDMSMSMCVCGVWSVVRARQGAYISRSDVLSMPGVTGKLTHESLGTISSQSGGRPGHS